MRVRLTLIVVLTMILAVSTGCARLSTSDQKIAALEDKVSIGMTESEFTQKLPAAQLVNEQDNRKVYVALVSQTCFICGSARGFQKSFESYATQFTIENGTLVSFNRILNGASIADRY